MAKPEYKEISIEDLNRSLIGDRANEIAPQPVQETVSTERASAPVAPLSVPTTTSTVQNAAAPPAAPPAASTTVSSHQKPGVAAPVDVSALARKVTTATNQMQEDLPAPNPEDSAQNMIDTIKEHWQVPATILGTAAGLAVLNHLMKKGGNNPPDDNNPPNNPPNNNSSGNSKTLKERIFGPNVQPIDKSIDIHMNEPSAQNPVAAQQTEAQFIASLSPAEQALYAKAQADKAAPTANISNEPYMSSNNNLFDDMQPTPAQLIEQKRIEKQAAITQAIQQSLATSNATNAPPQGTTLQPVTPAANAAPEPVLGVPAEPIAGAATPTTSAEPETPAVPVEPVATPAAEPITPAEPIATTTETPPTKATNDQILETLNKVAPKPEVTPIESTLGKPDLTTGSGMPAYQGKGEEGGKLQHKKGVFESLKQIPKDYVFVPNGQNMDILRNATGQEAYTKNLKATGGYPTTAQAAYEQGRNINKSLGRVSYEEAKAAGTLGEPTPSITQKVAGLKTVKVAGMTGALILATDLASAATTGESPLANMAQGFKEAVKNKDYGMAASQAAELLNFHPYTLLANQLFGTSPEELQILRQADQARKAGNAATSRR